MKWNNKWLWILAVGIIAQWLLPFNMIRTSSTIETEGTAFKFRTTGYDPHDPFRGKYITLGFEDNHFVTDKEDLTNWKNGQKIYVSIKNNPEGYAVIDTINKQVPDNTSHYFSTTVSYTNQRNNKVVVDFPFDRFYMDEWLIEEAEKYYTAAIRNDTQTTTALVYVCKGQYVLKNLYVDDLPLTDLLE